MDESKRENEGGECMMKKWTACVLLLCVLLGIGCYARAATGVSAVISNPDPTDRLNLRAAPREDAVSLGKYYNGVWVISYGVKDGWAEVDVQGRHGYMKDEFLTYGAAADRVQSAIPTMTVGTASLNLRAGDSQNSKTYGNYARGTQVEILGVGTTWHHVRIGTQVGYMMAKHLVGDVSFHKDQSSTGAQYAIVANPNPKDRLNLRDKPSEQGNSLGKFYNWTNVLVHEKRSDGWSRVSIGEGKGTISGYMQTKYLAFGERAKNVHSALLGYEVTVSNGIEATRGGADDWVRSVQAGEVLTVLGDCGDEYCFVSIGDESGPVTGYFPRWALSDKAI